MIVRLNVCGKCKGHKQGNSSSKCNKSNSITDHGNSTSYAHGRGTVGIMMPIVKVRGKGNVIALVIMVIAKALLSWCCKRTGNGNSNSDSNWHISSTHTITNAKVIETEAATAQALQ